MDAMNASLAKGVALGNLESIVDLTAAATAAAVLLALTQRATLGEGCRQHLSTRGPPAVSPGASSKALPCQDTGDQTHRAVM